MPPLQRHRLPSVPPALVLAALLSLGATAEERDERPDAPESGNVEDPETDSAGGEPSTADAEAPPSTAPPREPPPAVSITEARGPDVTLIAGEKRTVYEYRQNGKLRLIKVVPENGKPYFLAPRDPTQGFGDLEQADMLVPEWVLIEF